jgi:cellulose synthase/poly-beta-1,6-N-acetylglucosamine synthase-like glycosyltransferase
MELEEGNRRYRVYLSNHFFPLFTGSSGIIRWDVLSKYEFADGIFNEHQSVTEDWELSIRLQNDGYIIMGAPTSSKHGAGHQKITDHTKGNNTDGHMEL